MTAREFYEAVLIEVTSKGAPELLIDEFNYYFNKGQYAYVNKRYNAYDINQQTTDDLQVLKGTKIYKGTPDKPKEGFDPIKAVGKKTILPMGEVQEAIYTINLPNDYYHLLSCLVDYTLQKDFKCYNENYVFQFPTKRMTSDMYANIMTNAWLKPDYKRPYHFVQNNERSIIGDWAKENTPHTKDEIIKLINKEAGSQVSHNAFKDNAGTDGFNPGDQVVGPKLEINYGKDNSVFKLTGVTLQYLKAPELIRLTPEQLDSTEDHSQILQYPEYVCQEIVKETTKLILFHNADPKLQAYDPINTSVNPNPAQTPQKAAQQ